LSSHLLSENLKTKIFENVIFRVALYGCELGLTLREEYRPESVLRRIFGPKRDEVAGG
jgi:hypothetical protein